MYLKVNNYISMYLTPSLAEKAKGVFNDMQNNIIVNSSSKHEKCILNTSKLVVCVKTK